MPVAIGRCVHDDLQALSLTALRVPAISEACAAILCANINSGLRRCSARREFVKFAFVVFGKEDIVMGKIKALCLGIGEPDER